MELSDKQCRYCDTTGKLAFERISYSERRVVCDACRHLGPCIRGSQEQAWAAWTREQEEAIRVWRFYNAPQKYQQLSDHGGDEDWIALVPKGMDPDAINWAWEGTAFGRCDVQRIDLPTGEVVLIGAHA